MIFLQLFYEFFKTGLFAIGGGLATLPFLKQIALRYPWFTPNDLMDMIAISESTPGPIGVNSATYAGFHAAGIPGAITATCSLVLPSVIIIILVSRALDNYYLKTLVEMGYLGLAFFILLLFGLVLWSLRSIGRTGYTKGDRTRVLAVSMFAGMCGVLVHCYFENIFEVPYMMAYFWSMAAAVMYLGYFRKRKT